MENKFILAYMVYLTITMGLTLYVARTLFRNARVFMLDIFNGKEDIAHSTNKLFEVGFYLLNIGFAMKILKIDHYYRDVAFGYQAMVEVLASKIGGFSIYLGIMLFFNLFLFFRGRRKSREHRPLPPAIPHVETPKR
ncbi:MAG: hypothetical protein IPI00_16715 [Flavobacteriales bacterium]|nr:hypothetical protein [Flavobacteriales bacterium]MBK6945658.1 hypothetical protein [Flavobacteriales bacterium]MBK7241762.1 hypothetical protein [Flavobacteriales bacterium]MBK7296235.1 hypothetical protein [Flavobacteriales bacterium]MBK9534790.1 hypothetical protein [Flavobacteriales bacterium]